MFFCCMFLFFSLQLSLLDFQVSGCDEHCSDKPKFSKSSLVVKYGDPASVTCVACQKDCHEDHVGLEISVGETNQDGTTLSWTAENVIEWDLRPQCYYTTKSQQCCTTLPVTIYQPPKSVSISFVNHTGPILESSRYTLECNVQNVAPLRNLSVTFYKGPTVLGQRNSNKTIPKENQLQSERFTLDFIARKEDDGVQFWCEAKLELGPDGPEIPPVVTSEKVTATVHYGPELKVSPGPVTISIIKGKTLHLNCSAEGNPAPSYIWTFPSGNSSSNNSVLTIESVGFQHKGEYTCTVHNNVKSVQANFIVDVKANYRILCIIIGIRIGAVGLAAIFAGASLGYKCLCRGR